MFIIWGSMKTNKNFGTKQRGERCPYCQSGTYDYIRTLTWFTLFFIPLFPYSSTYSKLCNRCGNGIQINKAICLQEIAEADVALPEPMPFPEFEGAGFSFDPYTGQPIMNPNGKNFDAQTGLPLVNPNINGFDPYTGMPVMPPAMQVFTKDITIIRPKKFAGSLMPINICVDGNIAALLKNGAAETITVDSRMNSLYVSAQGENGQINSNIIPLQSFTGNKTFELEIKSGFTITLILK